MFSFFHLDSLFTDEFYKQLILLVNNSVVNVYV
jgi:hypothetical protein